MSLSDDQIWSLFWNVGGYLLTTAGLIWWFKDRLSNSEIRGLKAENDALKANVRLAETAASAGIRGLREANGALRDGNDTLKNNVKLAEARDTAEVNGLKAEINALKSHIGNVDARRELVEDQLKVSELKLAKVNTQLETANAQVPKGDAGALVRASISLAADSTNEAIVANTAARKALGTVIYLDDNLFPGEDPPGVKILNLLTPQKERLSAHPTATASSPAIALARLGFSKAKHHEGVSRGAHQVVDFLDDLAVRAVVEPKFLEPFGQVREHLEPAGVHSVEHGHKAGLDAVCAIVERRALGEHGELLRPILLGKLFA